MRRRILALLLAVATTSSARAGMITLSATDVMVDFPTSGTAKLGAKTDFGRFVFNDASQLQSITGMEITLTMQDGDTGLPNSNGAGQHGEPSGNFDTGKLTLGLDGIDTGLKLDGFENNQEMSLTFHLEKGQSGWMSDSVISQLMAKLNDNALNASILDATPDDNCVNLYSIFDTTIKLWGPGAQSVPEPLSVLVWSLVGIYGFSRWKKSRRGSGRPNQPAEAQATLSNMRV